MSMRVKLIANLQGRAASYWLNAQADARLAQEILIHLKNEATNPVKTDRFLEFTKRSLESDQARAFLGCCAFALWEINGRMDYEVAMFYAKLTDFSSHLPSNYYETDPPLPFPLVSSWTLPLLNNQTGLQKFLTMHDCNIATIRMQTFHHAIRAVQEINIAHNYETITSFSKNYSKKVDRLKELSRHSSYPDEFMRSAHNTQKAAIFWDRLYIKLLTV